LKYEINTTLKEHLVLLAGGLLILVSFLVYLAPFVIFEQSSRQAALVRVSLLVSSAIFIGVNLQSIKTFIHDRCGYVLLTVSLLFIYLFLNSFFLSDDLKSIRRLILLVFLFIPFLYIDFDERKIRVILALIASVISIFAVFSLLNHYFSGTLPHGYRKGGLIGSGVPGLASFGNTIVAGMHYAIAFSIVTYLYFTEANRLLLIVWGVFKVFVFYYIILTFARTAWVAALVSFLIIFLMTFDRYKIRFYIPLVIFISVLLFFLFNYMGYEVGERGLTARDEIWEVAIIEIKENIFFGHGLLNSIGWISIREGALRFNNVHSLYLEILYQVGVVGLFLYLLCILSAAYVLFKSFLLKVFGNLSVLFIAVLASISVVMSVDIIGWVNSPGLVWMWLWFPLAVCLSFERNLKLAINAQV